MYRLAVFLLVSAVSADNNDCFLARDAGNSFCGKDGAKSFFFHKQTRTCQPFFYKGCDGNSNRFASKSECQDACSKSSAPDDVVAAVCKSGAYAAGATSGSVAKCDDCPNGYVCEDDKCCPTKEYTCKLQYSAGKFGSNGKHTPRYFYSTAFKNCMLYTFYGRDGNANNFATYNECKKFCS